MVVGKGRGRRQQPLTGDGSDDTSSAQLIDLISLVVIPSFSTLFEPRERSIDFKRSFVVGDPILIKEVKLVRRVNSNHSQERAKKPLRLQKCSV
jgi:hypothetical protein